MIAEEYVGVLDGKYNLIRKLGSGATAKVYKGYEISTGESISFAIKVMDPMIQGMKEFRNEVQLLMGIDHQNVVKIFDKGEGKLIKKKKTKYVTYIVLEYLQNGELFDYLFFIKQGFGERLGRMIFLEILEGLEAIHKARIAHRDLKTENIMISSDFIVKISDFGYSTKIRDQLLTTVCGSRYYFPPELYSLKPYDGEKFDIFCLGVVLFLIVTGGMPYGENYATISDKFYSLIIQSNYDSFWSLYGDTLNYLSQDFKTFFVSLISFNPLSRPSIEQIKSISWIKEGYEDWNNYDYKQALKDELLNRTKLVYTKRWKVRRDNIIKKQLKLNNLSNGIYKGDSNCFKEEILKVIKVYIDNGNPYIIPFEEGTEANEIFEFLSDYFESEGAEFIVNCTYKYSSLVQLDENLKIKIELLKYKDNSYLIEFSLIKGDRILFEKFFNNLESYLDKLD